ncbi:hypothetical protein NE237_011813 [Protea cynaroides]|uniref:F-box domain-containing protein n=1 Tax=Protea cynaroides TaxID=273540 RepID=A0A9Q0GYY2_9MAGN|nr:hypothetical protein NE237_011813 [Protea cynaroides]
MEQGGTSTTDLYALGEDCIAEILSHISPRDTCRLSVVSSKFQSAADSDSVWERFLPSDMQLILSSSVSHSLPNFSSKKEQFLYLCNNPLLIDYGSKIFTLEKCSGKKCFMIGAKELSIFTLGGNTTNWISQSLPESRFPKVAELNIWREIRGKMETRLLSPNTTYVAYLVFKLTEFGFQYAPVLFSIKLGSGGGRLEEGQVKYVYLMTRRLTMADEHKSWRVIEEDEDILLEWRELLEPEAREKPKKRGDGWMEIKMGEFFNERGDDGEVEMRIKKVEDPYWGRNGFIIEGIEFRPKENQ